MNLRNLIKPAAIGAMLVPLAACSSRTPETATADVVARVGDATLSREELAKAMPAGLGEADSVAFAEAYVRTWVSDNLITEIAVKHLSNVEEIDRMAEDYRRQLIMWHYRQLMVRSDTSLAIADEQLHDYYDRHASELRLTQPMVRGIYIKMESNSPDLAKVRRLYKSTKQDDIDKLDKVDMHGAIHYDYFRDRWVPWEQIITKIPAEIATSGLRKGYTFELNKDGFTYLLSVSDVLPAGAAMPYEAAEERIRETLEAVRLTELDALLRRRLYDEAAAAGKL